MPRSPLREQLEAAEVAHGDALADIGEMIRVIRRQHDDGHSGAFRWCPEDVCQTANEMDAKHTEEN